MTLVMDGVRRSATVEPTMGSPVVTGGGAMAMAAAIPVVAPRRVATKRSAAGTRYFTGFDGVRRPVARSPREVLETMAAPMVAAMPEPAMVVPAMDLSEEIDLGEQTLAPARRWKWQRPAIAFGMVATALIAAGTVSAGLNTASNVSARTAPASAAPAAVVASPTPDPAAAALAAQQAGLQQLLDQFAAGQGDKFSIVVKDLKTGATATINPDRQLTSASLYKMYVAQQIYRMVDNGQISYGTPAGGGTGRNVEDCLKVMINISDNGCGRALGAILGWGKQDDALRKAGYTHTTLANSPQQTSAQDVSLMLERLYRGTLNSPNSNQRYMDLLKDQRVNNRLPVGLPQGTLIAHKTGDLDGYVHDAGIVYGPKTDYLVVVTSGQWARPGEAAPKFADLSTRLWRYFQ